MPKQHNLADFILVTTKNGKKGAGVDEMTIPALKYIAEVVKVPEVAKKVAIGEVYQETEDPFEALEAIEVEDEDFNTKLEKVSKKLGEL